MSVKTGQAVTALLATVHPAIGSAVDADNLPTAVLYLNGTANGAAVTVTNLATGLYKAAVTMPAIAAGDRASLVATAVVAGVTGRGVVWGDVGETATASDVKTVADAIAAKTTNLPGDPADESLLEAAIASAHSTTNGKIDAVDDLLDTEMPAITAAVVTDIPATLSTIDGHVSDTFDDVGDVKAVVDSILADTGTTLDDKLDAIKLKTDAIGALAVTVSSPVAESGSITIYQGDDYDATYGRELSFAVDDATHAFGLDAAEAVVRLKMSQATWTGATVESDAGYTVTFEPTAAQTAVLTIARQAYELEATLADGDVVTLSRGTVSVVKDILAV